MSAAVKPAPVAAPAPATKAPEPKAIPIVAEAPPLVLTPVEAPRIPRPRGRPRLVKAEAKAEAEEAEKKRIEREQKAEQKAPDKQKLLTLAEKIEALEMPDAKSAEAKKILSDTRGLLNKTAKFIREQTENL